MAIRAECFKRMTIPGSIERLKGRLVYSPGRLCLRKIKVGELEHVNAADEHETWSCHAMLLFNIRLG